MRLRPLVLACGFVFLLAVSARAGALDAPSEKKVTVKDEIQRGYSAALKVENFGAGPQAFEEAIRILEDKNEQQRTDSEGFKLGMAFAAWQFNWQLLSSGLAFVPVGKGEKLDAAQLTASMANLWYHTFQGSSTNLGVTADDLKELFGAHGYEPARDNATWEAAAQSKQYKGTMPRAGSAKP